MTVQELCKQIELQETLEVRVIKFILSYDFSPIKSILEELMSPQTAECAYKKLAEIFKDDEDQINMLACQLFCATKVYEKYQEKGIPEQIYIDTMKCFPRFISECKEKTGKYDFDRAWWTYRQLSMTLFRIGQLEYELLEHDSIKKIDMHIPSDADFSPEMVDDSIRMAKEFLDKYCPEYVGCEFVCESWLLSPMLQKVLSEKSNIISFQNRFRIYKQDMEAKDVFEWVFKTSSDCELEQLKEETSLQRKMKQLLLNDENVGIGFGILK